MILYNLITRLYYIAIILSYPFNTKAKKWIKGRKSLIRKLHCAIPDNQKVYWFHCASLGEFEQGRPLIEKIKRENPHIFILLTFFSPSGFEVRKSYKDADYICYLPFDSAKNASQFIQAVDPEKVFFVKYEFWYHYLEKLSKADIPVYLVSGIFRRNQIFFKWYGGAYKRVLHFFSHIFVQNESSKDILEQEGIADVTLSGDTRYDRVYEISIHVNHYPEIKKFKNDKKLVIAGSTWPNDHELIIQYINTKKNDPVKFIIAPHEINKGQIDKMIGNIEVPAFRYSEIKMKNPEKNKVLIIDNIGMLSSLYQYADIAYIGGGFGHGIHNILEAATFGMPIFFGPNYHKFAEALALIEKGVAFPVNCFNELYPAADELLGDDDKLSAIAIKSKKFVKDNTGAVNLICDTIGV
jgi:3-deoxy-D-manno-octulosonic-acid transferase